MRNIVVIPNAYKDPGYIYSRRVVTRLIRFGARVFLDGALRHEFSSNGIHYYDREFPNDAEMILVIGGDGSVLDASVYALGADIPILGINLGRVGYLAELESHEADALARLVSDEYGIKEHITLAVSLVRNGEEMHLVRCAVNDVVIGQGVGAGMSEILLEDGAGNQMTYMADGLIVATPLGSTAYSLSAGGPVIDASLAAFCVTPICAHSLFSRSVLFPPEYTLTVRNDSARSGEMLVTVDGAETYTLAPGDCVKICRSDKVLRMISLKNQSVLGILRRKMQLLNPQK